MRAKIFFFLGWFSNITFISTGARQQDLNEEVLDSALVDPDKRTAVKNMHCAHGTWGKVWMLSTVDTRQWTVPPWFACITTQSVSISARKWGFHCCQMNEQAAANKPHSYSWLLSGFFLPVHLLCHGFPTWAETVHFLDSAANSIEFSDFLLFKRCWGFVAMVTTHKQLTTMSRSRWLLLIWLFISVFCITSLYVFMNLPHQHSHMLLHVLFFANNPGTVFFVVVFVEQGGSR